MAFFYSDIVQKICLLIVTYWGYILGFLIGIASGLAVNMFVVWVQRPVIAISEDDDDPSYPEAFFHVVVKNKKVRLGDRFFQRAMAVDCESQVSFMDKTTGKLVPYSPFKTKWARQNEGLPNSLTRMNLYVGQRDGDKKGVQLDIILRKADEGFGWICDPEREAAERRRENLGKWQLPFGSYLVKVQIQYAQHTSDPKFFTLENNADFKRTKLISAKDTMRQANNYAILSKVKSKLERKHS